MSKLWDVPGEAMKEGSSANDRCARLTTRPGLHNRVVLFSTRYVTFVTFGLFAALGGMLSFVVVFARQVQAGLEPERYAFSLFVVIPILILLGSRLFVLAIQWRSLQENPIETLRKPGFAFQGGLIAATVGAVTIAAVNQLDMLLFLDTFCLGLPLGHAIGRLGCHSYGCCHGKPTCWAPGIRYTNPDSKAVWDSGLAGVELHPTQFYSALGNLGLFLLLNLLATSELKAGMIGACYLILGSFGRVVIEFYRGIPVRRFGQLSLFQLVALGLLLSGVVLLVVSIVGEAKSDFGDVAIFHQALLSSFSLAGYFVWLFVMLFVAFGIHGKRVGRL